MPSSIPGIKLYCTVIFNFPHSRYDRKRLSNDLAVLRLNQRVNLNNPYVNTACLPTCRDQFSFQFR